MTAIRIVADDLTGALDTAAGFASAAAPIPVYWRGLPRPVPGGSFAIDSGTREGGRDQARAVVAGLAAGLAASADTVLYAKLDSLLRGHGGAEIAAWLSVLGPIRCVIAPAFPFQGRITRGGRQLFRTADGWRATGNDLCSELEREGLAVSCCRPGAPVPAGISLWDAETDADLAAIAQAGRATGAPVLWCGSGGLAAALAGDPGPRAEQSVPRPVLGLFGTNHPVMLAQLAACGPYFTLLPSGAAGHAATLARLLADRGVALAGLDLPAGVSREAAARTLGRELGALARQLDPPGTLLVAGGETLRAVCGALGAERLEVDGQCLPGVPRSILRGGRYDGVRVISKAGAFGDPALLRRLLALDLSGFQGVPS